MIKVPDPVDLAAAGAYGAAIYPGDTAMRTAVLTRAVAATAAPLLVVAGLTATAAPAQAAGGISTRYMLSQLDPGGEHTAGYDRAKFSHWADADGDGCDARDEVLIQEAVVAPRVRSGCELSGGRWWSRYDGVRTTNPSMFDVDHMVPLNEAWQSGAWRWSAAKRKAFANDLGYRASLIAVSASSNRSKSDREPQDWMPERAAYSCRYVAQWVAVKWRWQLKVNAAESSAVRSELASCGWPRVPRPSRPVISSGSTGTGGSTGGGGSAGGGGSTGGLDPQFDYCYNAIDAGYGPYYRGSDPEYDWYTDSDSDGVVCET